MTKIQLQNPFVFQLSMLLCLAFIGACDSDNSGIQNTQAINTNISPDSSTPPETEQTTTKPEIENKSYLFDVSDHSIDELEALLIRAEEVSQTHPADFDDLEIVMILHGPDIDWFTQQNYEHNRELIDLAARLDAYEVIDMKVCDRTLQSRGVAKDDLPSFIESVPYAPIEIKQRLQDGYINL
jgi:uncharacterized protein